MLKLPDRTRATPVSSTQASIRRHLQAIGVGAGVLVLGFGAMGATTKLAGAVMAGGTIEVKSNVKRVAHVTGGNVGALFVQDGSRVKAGDVLVHLDETVAQANLSALTKSWFELLAQRARLEAERDGRDSAAFPQDLLDAAINDPSVKLIVTGEANLLQLRRGARAGQQAQMRRQIDQLRDQIDGLKKQDAAKAQERAIVTKELAGVRYLYERSLVQLSRLDALERDATRIEGERGSIASQIAQAIGKIAETELKIIQVDEDMRSDVGKQLADIRAKTSDIVERRVAALDLLQHLDIRAPQDGVVHELAVHAKGAVVGPNDPVMMIVPDDELVAQVHVAPQDIDKVSAGQATILRFPNFNQRTTPEVTTKVERVSPDTTQDKKDGAPYYIVQVTLPADGHIDGQALRPGMPVDAFIRTDERTLLSYLVKPLADQMERAFREK